MKHDELDLETLARARAGDPRAFRRLYEHHVDALHAFLLRMLRESAWAEDALQETFMRVLRGLSSFSPEGPARLSTWIFTIGRRVALDELARRRVRSAEPPPSPEDASRTRPDLRVDLEAAVARLPLPQRTVFVLYEGCRFRYEEIAVIEGIDVGTVKSRLHRARAALQAAFRDTPSDQSSRDEEEEEPREQRALR
jgi:RNA polymerase sigma-70 factor (ECF subfamily)